jgi:hypothetical protein
LVVWGVVITMITTFALSWGWVHFEATPSQDYEMYVFDLRVLTFAPLTWWAWIVFHVLDVAAVIVIAGCGYFLWRRMRDRRSPAASGSATTCSRWWRSWRSRRRASSEPLLRELLEDLRAGYVS